MNGSTRTCSVDGCCGVHYAKGFCCKHYWRAKKHGSPHMVHVSHPSTCSVEGCERVAVSRSYCRLHYERVRRIGSTELRSRPDARERFESRLLETTSGCLEWTGSRNADGYGSATRGRSSALAHRLAWELAYGPIPQGRLVCHRCDNPPCCNPEHLFLGTQSDNMRDMAAKGRSSGQKVTHCAHGHEFDEANTKMIRRKNGRYQRRCRTCEKVRQSRKGSTEDVQSPLRRRGCAS